MKVRATNVTKAAKAAKASRTPKKEVKERQGANRRQKLRHRRAQRHQRLQGLGQSLVRRMVWIVGAVSLAGALGAGGWWGYSAYQRGNILTVHRIEVVGNRQWETPRLLKAAGLEVGMRLPELSLLQARAAMRQLPGIQEVTLRRSFTGVLRVEVREGEILALRRQRGWQGLTADGGWMPLSEEGSRLDLPVVENQGSENPDAQALGAFLATARGSYPDLFGGFSQIVTRGRDDADIYWRDGRFKVRVDVANKSLNSLEFLRTLLHREGGNWRRGSTIDLRVEDYAYVL